MERLRVSASRNSSKRKVQRLAKNLFLGCMTCPHAQWRVTQPRKRYLADLWICSLQRTRISTKHRFLVELKIPENNVQRSATKFFCFAKHHPGSARQKYTQPGKRNLADLCILEALQWSQIAFASYASFSIRTPIGNGNRLILGSCESPERRTRAPTNIASRFRIPMPLSVPPPSHLLLLADPAQRPIPHCTALSV